MIRCPFEQMRSVAACFAAEARARRNSARSDPAPSHRSAPQRGVAGRRASSRWLRPPIDVAAAGPCRQDRQSPRISLAVERLSLPGSGKSGYPAAPRTRDHPCKEVPTDSRLAGPSRTSERRFLSNESDEMPTIAIVDGVKIQMFYNDHTPPHFHAILGGDEVLVAIHSLDVIRGALPSAKLRRVLASANDHQGELAVNWIRCQDDQRPERI